MQGTSYSNVWFVSRPTPWRRCNSKDNFILFFVFHTANALWRVRQLRPHADQPGLSQVQQFHCEPREACIDDRARGERHGKEYAEHGKSKFGEGGRNKDDLLQRSAEKVNQRDKIWWDAKIAMRSLITQGLLGALIALKLRSFEEKKALRINECWVLERLMYKSKNLTGLSVVKLPWQLINQSINIELS